MNTTVEALKALYVACGGALTDKYEGIADGDEVGNYTLIPDCINVLKNVSGGSGTTHVKCTFTSDGDDQKYFILSDFSKTTAEMKAIIDAGGEVVIDANYEGQTISFRFGGTYPKENGLFFFSSMNGALFNVLCEDAEQVGKPQTFGEGSIHSLT